MHGANQQGLIIIEGRATYERILSGLGAVEQEEAIRQIQNFLKVYPDFAQAHNDLAVIFYRGGNALLALAHHEKAHKLDPLNITFRKNLADFYAVELDWTDEAIHIYLDILKDNPFDIESLTALGTIHERAGRREQARQFFTRAHQLDPLAKDARDALQLMNGVQPALPQESAATGIPSAAPPPYSYQPPPETLHEQALQAANGGQVQAAIHLLEQLTTQHPDYAVAYNDLGVLYQRTGNVQQALRHHEQAVALEPANDTFRKNLAELLAVGGKRYEEALKIYLDLLSTNPRDVDTLHGMAYICLETGKPADARVFLERILNIDPGNQDARQRLDALLPQAAPPRYRAADEIHAEASRHAAENRLEEAKSLLQELVQLYPDHALGFNDLGVVRYKLGDIEGCRRDYEKAVQLEPRNVNFRKNLADLYFAELGRIDESIGIYLELYKEHPGDVETLKSLGVICSAVDRPDEARTFFNKAFALEPWNPDVRAALQQLG